MPAVDASFNLPNVAAAMAQPSDVPRFHIKPRRNEEKSVQAGYPMFDDVEYVEIRVAGDRLNVLDLPVEEKHRQMYRAQYLAWKEGRDQNTASGLPLAQWPQVTASEVESLNYFRVYTVEQLAGVTDEQRSRMGVGWQRLVKAAKDYLANAKSNAHVAQMRAELEKRDAEMATLKEMVAALQKEVAEKPKKAK